MNIEILKKVTMELNNTKCNWAIGGSLLLSYYGLVEEPRDIDILIDAKDSEKVKEAMDKIGERLECKKIDLFRTEKFFRYLIDEVEVEFLGDFKIALESNEIYEFILDEKAFFTVMFGEELMVNLSTLEDWYVAYIVMNDPKNRVPILKEYFIRNGIKHRNLIERSLNQKLPEDIKNCIKEVIDIK